MAESQALSRLVSTCLEGQRHIMRRFGEPAVLTRKKVLPVRDSRRGRQDACKFLLLGAEGSKLYMNQVRVMLRCECNLLFSKQEARCVESGEARVEHLAASKL